MADRRPYSRSEYNRALIANALLDPFNVVLLAVVLVIGIVTGIGLLAPAAVVLYLAGAVRTYFDSDVADKVLARQRERRRDALQKGRTTLREQDLDPAIAALVHQAREREARIRQAIDGADLPYEEVADEVDRFVAAMEDTARRAQLLASALHDTPPEQVAARLRALQQEANPDQKELVDALQTQSSTLERMQRQLARFQTEMERILVELDTVRGQLVSVSASTGAAQGAELASEVRSLREQMGAVADGMAEAYEAQKP